MIRAPVLLALLAFVPAALAADDPAARSKELFQEAQKLYKQGKYADAIVKLDEANALKPHPVINYNIARCHEQLGDVPKALRAYRDYLRLSPDAKDKQAVSDSIANLERKLKERGLQQVMIFAEPATAAITVDGKELGTSPASIELTAGEHKVTVKAEGHETVDRPFAVALGRTDELTITLKPAGAAAPAAESPPAKTDSTAKAEAAPAASTSTATVTSTPGAKPRGRLFTWVAAGVAVVGFGAGIGLGVTAQGAASRLTSGLAMDRDMADAWKGQASSMSLGANVCYGVAAVALIAAAVLFFLEGR